MRALTRHVGLLLLLASSEPQASELEASEFCALLEPELQTMYYAEPLGIRDGRAYLALHTMSTLDKSSWKRELYWSEAATLPDPCHARFAAAKRRE